MDVRELAQGSGWKIEESEGDTTNIVGKNGHIYADKGGLVVSMNCASKGQARHLKGIGTTIMNGDFGEISVLIDPSQLREAAKLIKPYQRGW